MVYWTALLLPYDDSLAVNAVSPLCRKTLQVLLNPKSRFSLAQVLALCSPVGQVWTCLMTSLWVSPSPWTGKNNLQCDPANNTAGETTECCFVFCPSNLICQVLYDPGCYTRTRCQTKIICRFHPLKVLVSDMLQPYLWFSIWCSLSWCVHTKPTWSHSR